MNDNVDSISSSIQRGIYDRTNPLFERLNVPCEYITYNDNSNNSSRCTGHNKIIWFCTIRILEGRREQITKNSSSFRGGTGTSGIGGMIAGSMERSIRFEISDECHYYSSRQEHEHMLKHNFLKNNNANNTSHYDQGDRRINPNFVSSVSCASPTSLDQRQNEYFGEKGKSVPVMMQSNSQHHNQTARTNVNRMSNASSKSTSSLSSNVLRHTPVNLYELEVGESDFSTLKHDQSLLVDFHDFASSFISLLQFCDLGSSSSDEENEGNETQDKTFCNSNDKERSDRNKNAGWYSPESGNGNKMNIESKYSCRLEDFSSLSSNNSNHNNRAGAGGINSGNSNKRQSARFSVVESNKFRELTHLSLNLSPGNDSTIRGYLSERLFQTMDENRNFHNRLKEEISRACHSEELVKSMSDELKQLSISSETERRELKLDMGERTQKENQQREEEHKRAFEEKDNEIRSLTHKMESEVKCIRVKFEDIQKEQQNLLKEKYELEGIVDQLQGNLSRRNQTVEDLTCEMTQMKEKSQHLEEYKQMVEKKLHETEIRAAALEQSNKSQEAALLQAEALRKASEQAGVQCHESLDMHKSQLEEVRTQLDATAAEVHKANDVIRSLQRDRQEMKRKLKSRSVIVKRQEQILSERENIITELQREIKETSSEKERLDSENKSKDKQISEAKQKMMESAKLLESNQQVISWLNREINETQLGRSTPSNTFGQGTTGVTTRNNEDPGNIFRPSHITPDLRGGVGNHSNMASYMNYSTANSASYNPKMTLSAHNTVQSSYTPSNVATSHPIPNQKHLSENNNNWNKQNQMY